MKIKELKKFIENLPDEMPVNLRDLTTDNFDHLNYALCGKDLMIDDYVEEEGGEIVGKMLFITFENQLNENSILED